MNEISGARVVENREVARGTRWLVVEAEDGLPAPFSPGHIVALFVPQLNGRWERHPYTASWSEGDRLGILYRVIPGGRSTPTLAAMVPGETVRLAGRFGEPVSRLVGDAPAVIGVSTGTGIGPLWGFAADGRAVTLVAGFREAIDIPFAAELEALPSVRWVPTLTRPTPGWTGRVGRVSSSLASVAIPDAHWHLVGNGAMVADVRGGLLAAGVRPERITAEVYFNKGVAADPAVVAEIARSFG